MEQRIPIKLKTAVVACAAAAVAVFALATSSAAAGAVPERVTTVATPPAPGPAQYNRVTVHEFGAKSADHVLVLMPGTDGGAGDFTLDAQWLVKNVAGPAGLGGRPARERARGHRDVRAGTGRYEDAAGGLRLLPRLDRRRDAAFALPVPRLLAVRLREAMGDGGRARRRPRRDREGPQAGPATSSSAATPSVPRSRSPTRPGTSTGGPATRTSRARCSSTAACSAASIPTTSRRPSRRWISSTSPTRAPSSTCSASASRKRPACSRRSVACSRSSRRPPTARRCRTSRSCRRSSSRRCRRPTGRSSVTRSTATPRRADLGLLHVNGGSLDTSVQPRRLEGRQHHAGRAHRRHVRPGADQRRRLVLPATHHDRRERRRPDEAKRRREVPRAAP